MGPTVVETCLDLSGWGNSCSGFLLACRVGVGEAGGGLRIFLVDGLKFFNRSPITLKFGAEKLERESQERESESERAKAIESEIESERVVILRL